MAFGGFGALAADGHSGYGDGAAMGEVLEVFGAEDVSLAEFFPPQAHRVRADGGTLGCVVGGQAFGHFHGWHDSVIGGVV